MSEATPQPSIDLGAIAPELPATCAEYLRTYRVELEEAIDAGRGGVELAQRHARTLDGLLGSLYCAADAAIRAAGHAPLGRAALVAVGGYGRGLVALHSDVDLLLLCDDPSDHYVEIITESLLYPIWDLGLSIGHAVRDLDGTLKLAREDIRTATTLLDLRWVAGNRTVVNDLRRGARRHVFEPALGDFLDALESDTLQRHERFGGSLYLLEPEVKLGRGGLRDLDVAEWAAGARWACESAEDYVRKGALLSREVEELNHAREMLWRVRNLLHRRAGRRHDRLIFGDQELIAEQLGFTDGVTLAVEQFMQSYYRHARIVAQTAERMLARARSKSRGRRSVEDLGDGTIVFDGHVTFEESDRLAEDPSLALRLYRRVLERKLRPFPYARDAIARIAVHEEWRERLRRSQEARDIFFQLLCFAGEAPVRRGSILGELHEVGLMVSMIPEFEPLTGRVQHDIYHVYTVDVHSVAAVDRLRALVRGDLKGDLPLPCRLAAEAPRPLPLFLGVLLHDIGKAHGKDHSEKGAVIARKVAERLSLPSPDIEHVVWLVRSHLNLYHWATRRDTADPETIDELAQVVGTVERLRDLYLLTVADLSTTNPTAMTAWKARMFDDLYLALAAALEGEGGHSGRADDIRADVSIGFVGDASQADLEAFVRGMPDRYVLANPVDVIRTHAHFAMARGDDLVHVGVLPASTPDVADLLVATDDRPGLLSDVAAVLASQRLSVVTAQIYTRENDRGVKEAFDIFQVRRDGSGADLVGPRMVARIQRDLRDLLCGKVGAQEILGRLRSTPEWAQRHVPQVSTEVIVDNEASPRFTVVDVFTRDRLGLLHILARTLREEGLTIALSKISTEGLRAADVFYVTEATGEKMKDPARVQHLMDVLTRALMSYHQRWEKGGT